MTSSSTSNAKVIIDREGKKGGDEHDDYSVVVEGSAGLYWSSDGEEKKGSAWQWFLVWVKVVYAVVHRRDRAMMCEKSNGGPHGEKRTKGRGEGEVGDGGDAPSVVYGCFSFVGGRTWRETKRRGQRLKMKERGEMFGGRGPSKKMKGRSTGVCGGLKEKNEEKII
ncbi:hypothetical protein HAX54_036150 [Datura stramonium]|uniref:Uncharacterized protein n=1 Tax=Datura stramonium TaxID=4076 RepID=A0ABS8VIR2_DATST|nr:hypothetical protein [Datura stramonium]